MSLVCPIVVCAGVAGGAESVGLDHCRIPNEPAVLKRRVTRPAHAVSTWLRMVYETCSPLEYSAIDLQVYIADIELDVL